MYEAKREEEHSQSHTSALSVYMHCNDARLGLHHKVCSLNCQPKPQHLELCFPWIWDTYKKGWHLWNYTHEVSGVQVFLSAQVCGLRFPTLTPQTFLHSI